MSNNYTLNNYLAISTFNAESDHTIKVKINQSKIFEETLVKNKEHQLKITDHFNYEGPGANTIEITWNGEKECAIKYLKIYKVVVHDQHIQPHSVMITPLQNEYITNLIATEEGAKAYRHKLFNPGHEHGWYGQYKFNFLLDRHKIKEKQQSLIRSTGIRQVNIFSDASKNFFDRKAYKNENKQI